MLDLRGKTEKITKKEFGNVSRFWRGIEFIKDNEVRVIDLKWGDLFGRWHHVSLSAESFTPQMMRDGIGFRWVCRWL
jgi:hypothetical protein